MISDQDALLSRISRIEQIRGPLVRVAVIGVGYIGLPLAVRIAEKGFRVFGLDINEKKINLLRSGISTVEGIPDSIIQRLQNDKQLSFIKAPKKPKDYETQAKEVLASLAGTEIFLICVHTPLHRERLLEPDIQWIKESARLIEALCQIEQQRGCLPGERLLVLESTTFPGTTRHVFAGRFQRFSGMRIYLAYSPERINPASQSFGYDGESDSIAWDTTKILGSADAEGRRVALAFYLRLFTEIHPVSSLEAAETVKLLENTFRFLAIGFSNEMSQLASLMGLDFWELAEAARTKRFGFDFCDLGLAGGHCIPSDPHYLAWQSRRCGVVPGLVEIAEMAHQRLVREAFALIQEILNHRGHPLKGASILLWGITYKPGVADIRESGVLRVAKRLHLSRAKVSYWDPVWQETGRPVYLDLVSGEMEVLESELDLKPASDGASSPHHRISSVDRPLPDGVDCVVIGTGHPVFEKEYEHLVDSGVMIVDLSNAIFTWAGGLSSEKEKDVRAKLSVTGRYALLGVGVGPLRERINQKKEQEQRKEQKLPI